jgi:transketolase
MADLVDHTARARAEIVKAIATARAGHLGGPLSAIDILCALYFRVMRIRPEQPDWTDRDRFILSKGHSSIALYAVMALRGYLPVSELQTFDALDSRLQGHPDMTALPGLDMSTGSLGLGFSAAVGIALGAKLADKTFTTYVMLGDGECNEGSVWEGAHVAERFRLDNLVAIIDFNRLQQTGWVDHESGQRMAPYSVAELRERWASFGWRVTEINGHDLQEIVAALDAASSREGSPEVILAHTVKGKGVSFMENQSAWHSRVPTAAELELALSEIAAPREPAGAGT